MPFFFHPFQNSTSFLWKRAKQQPPPPQQKQKSILLYCVASLYVDTFSLAFVFIK